MVWCMRIKVTLGVEICVGGVESVNLSKAFRVSTRPANCSHESVFLRNFRDFDKDTDVIGSNLLSERV